MRKFALVCGMTIIAATVSRTGSAQPAAKITPISQFAERFKVQQWVDHTRLREDAWRYRDKVVGVYAQFVDMAPSGEARFTNMVVSDVPANTFTSRNQEVYLAVRLNGVTPVGTSRGDTVVPHGKFVGVYKCRETRCRDFFN